MVYDRECYLRRKQGIVKKACKEEIEAYSKIKNKWGFDNIKIRKLLRDYTVSEIFNGTWREGEFKPKEIYKVLGILLVIGISYLGYNSEITNEQIISYKECINSMFNTK